MTLSTTLLSPGYYQQLPSLGQAHEAFTAAQASPIIDSEIRDVFVNHGVTEQFGLSLLHGHFEMEDGEILVDYKGVAVPWKVEPWAISYNGLGHLGPRSWAFGGGAILPYEYYFDLHKPPAVPPNEFLSDLALVLEKHGLCHVLGVQACGADEQPVVEFTEGRANVSVPIDADDLTGLVEAMWMFDNDGEERRKKKKCVAYCWPTMDD